MRVLTLLAPFSAVLFLTGCVGGISPSASTSAAAPSVAGVGMQTNGVATNRAIDVQFSTAMNPATINTQTFLLAKAMGGTPVTGTVTYDGTNFVASFQASTALDVNTAYNATLTTGVADIAGHHLAAKYGFSFTTRDSGDSSNIKVYETLPTNEQASVAVSSAIKVVFSEGAASNTVNTNTFVVKDGSGTSVSGSVTYDIVTNYATFTPLASLMPGATYTVTISGVTDLAGEAMAAPYTFTFITAGATVQAQDLVYETDVSAGTILGWVFDPAGGTLTQAAGSPFASRLEPLQMVLSPNLDTLYAIMGNQPPGLRGTNCFNFTTQVISYAVDHATGTLTQEQVINLNGYCAANSGAIDPLGHYLYVGESDGGGSSGMIDVISLGNAGQMTLVPGSPFSSPQTPTWLVVDGNYIYAANNVNFETEGLLTFQRNPSTGAVQFQSGLTIPPQNSLATSLSGGTLYSVDANQGIISEFKVNSTTGTLVPQGTVTTGTLASQMETDPTGRYVGVAASNGVNIYNISATGDLTPVAGSPFGGSASAVMFDSTGSYFTTLQAQVKVYRLSNNTVNLVANTQGTYNPGTLTMLTK